MKRAFAASHSGEPRGAVTLSGWSVSTLARYAAFTCAMLADALTPSSSYAAGIEKPERAHRVPDTSQSKHCMKSSPKWTQRRSKDPRRSPSVSFQQRGSRSSRIAVSIAFGRSTQSEQRSSHSAFTCCSAPSAVTRTDCRSSVDASTSIQNAVDARMTPTAERHERRGRASRFHRAPATPRRSWSDAGALASATAATSAGEPGCICGRCVASHGASGPEASACTPATAAASGPGRSPPPALADASHTATAAPAARSHERLASAAASGSTRLKWSPTHAPSTSWTTQRTRSEKKPPTLPGRLAAAAAAAREAAARAREPAPATAAAASIPSSRSASASRRT